MHLQHPTESGISVSTQQTVIIIVIIIVVCYCLHNNSLLDLDFMSYKQEIVSFILKFHCPQKTFLSDFTLLLCGFSCYFWVLNKSHIFSIFKV